MTHILYQHITKLLQGIKFILSDDLHESFYYISLEYLSLWDKFHLLLLIAQTCLSEEHVHKIFFSQNNLSEARENF
jgi:hypothetical protein